MPAEVNATWRYVPSETWRGAKAAVAILSFDVDAETPVLAAGDYTYHLSTISHQQYGPMIGVPRIIKLLARYGKPATFFIPGWTAQHYPACVEAVLEAGHEVALHGYTHRPPCYLTAAEQREEIERSLAVFEPWGLEFKGYRAPMWQTSRDTLEILGEYGVVYDSSLMDDDRPYILETPSGKIVEMCPQWYLDDWEQYAYLPDPDVGHFINRPGAVGDLWVEEMDAYREHGSLLVLTCHPFLSGRPARLRAIEKLIRFADECGDVEFARHDTIAERMLGAKIVLDERPEDAKSRPAGALAGVGGATVEHKERA